jgi:hypothetical protein
VERLTLEEKVALLSGHDKWSLPSVPAIGLESIVMSDGPTGVKRDGSRPLRSPLIPCGTAITGLGEEFECEGFDRSSLELPAGNSS